MLLEKFADLTNSSTLLELSKSQLETKDPKLIPCSAIKSSSMAGKSPTNHDKWTLKREYDQTKPGISCLNIRRYPVGKTGCHGSIATKSQKMPHVPSKSSMTDMTHTCSRHFSEDFEMLLEKLAAESDNDRSQEFCASVLKLLGFGAPRVLSSSQLCMAGTC